MKDLDKLEDSSFPKKERMRPRLKGWDDVNYKGSEYMNLERKKIVNLLRNSIGKKLDDVYSKYCKKNKGDLDKERALISKRELFKRNAKDFIVNKSGIIIKEKDPKYNNSGPRYFVFNPGYKLSNKIRDDLRIIFGDYGFSNIINSISITLIRKNTITELILDYYNRRRKGNRTKEDIDFVEDLLNDKVFIKFNADSGYRNYMKIKKEKKDQANKIKREVNKQKEEYRKNLLRNTIEERKRED